mgnify:CR=1 FL=1
MLHLFQVNRRNRLPNKERNDLPLPDTAAARMIEHLYEYWPHLTDSERVWVERFEEKVDAGTTLSCRQAEVLENIANHSFAVATGMAKKKPDAYKRRAI